MVVRVQHPVAGEILLNGNPVKLSDTKVQIRKPSPTLGQHNDTVYGKELGLSALELQQLREDHVI